MTSNVECPLCIELATGASPLEWAPAMGRRHHLDAGEVVTFAALTPLRDGHLMVVPKAHVKSFAAAPIAVRAALDQQVLRLRTFGTGDAATLLTFEHGIAPGEDGGCGISHAHVHVLPVSAEESTAILRALRTTYPSPTPNRRADWDALAGSSYLRVHDVGSGEVVAATGDFPSQTLRRLIAAVIGSPHDDWRRHGNWDAMRRADRALEAASGGSLVAA